MKYTFESNSAKDTAAELDITFDDTPGNGFVLVTVTSLSNEEMAIRVPVIIMQQCLALFNFAPPTES